MRGELQVVSVAEASTDGYVVVDPFRQSYYRIDRAAAEALSVWPQCATVDDVVAAVENRYGNAVGVEDVVALIAFLDAHNLTVETDAPRWERLAEHERQANARTLKWLVHNYLFMRIPVLRPEPFLKIIQPLMEPLFTRPFAWAIAILGAFGLYLVSRQWDAFLTTFPHFFSLSGMLTYALALVIVKSLHEIGHALTAVRYGCRVPSMGICVVVLVPMLYTDVTDAWKLRDRHQRLRIGAAGLIVEVYLACLATLLWVFLADGPARSVAFAVATTGWVLSIILNLNIFMKFDGYFILSDFFNIENLQSRAFAFGQWRLREVIFGYGLPPPERLSQRRMFYFTLYASATWVYRLVVFTGIAIAVYLMTFKLLGLVLFAIEIVVFIMRPIKQELQCWRQLAQSSRDHAAYSVRIWPYRRRCMGSLRAMGQQHRTAQCGRSRTQCADICAARRAHSCAPRQIWRSRCCGDGNRAT